MTHLAAELTLEAVLEIWQSTTSRLEQTHLVLQSEVRRLTDELEEKNRQLAKKNRLADLGQMAGHVAHEVRNHLVPLTLYLSLLRRQLSGVGPSAAPANHLSEIELLDKVDTNLTAMRTMVQDLLTSPPIGNHNGQPLPYNRWSANCSEKSKPSVKRRESPWLAKFRRKRICHAMSRCCAVPCEISCLTRSTP